MNQQNLREHIAEYYDDRELSPETLERLEAIADGAVPRRSWIRMAAVAAVFAVAGGGIALLSSDGRSSHQDRDRAQLIGEEIAMNHNKQLAVEVPAATYDGLANNLDKLDFRPFEPLYVDTELQLLGARYCSIQGNIAAQIKLVESGHGVLRTCDRTPGRSWRMPRPLPMRIGVPLLVALRPN